MTALVVLENCQLFETVTVPKEAVGTEGSSAYLRIGEQLSVLDLLYCLMLRSANDAAVALAYHTAGSVEAFAGLMNEKAKALDLSNCHFENPHGLDSQNHYISAKDMAALAAYCLNNPLFCKIVSTKSITIGNGENARLLTNHNRLLQTLPGCIGVKTGYTIRSGRCLVSACEKEETVLVCVTFNCRPDWQTHTDLYAYGFSVCKRVSFAGFSKDLAVAGRDAPLHVSSEGYSMLIAPQDTLSFVPICPHLLFAPIEAGQQIGRVEVRLDGTVIDVLPITAREEAAAPPSPGFLSKLLSFVFSLLGGK
jgi:D-alanyl-D-alanine carboxypeptidase